MVKCFYNSNLKIDKQLGDRFVLVGNFNLSKRHLL